MSFENDVIKSLVVVRPTAATEDRCAALRGLLVEAGFVVVREETRALTADTCKKLGVAGDFAGNARLFVVARTDATNALAAFCQERPEVAAWLNVPTNHDEAAARLLSLFPRMTVDPLPTNAAAREYVDREMKELLVKALTATAKKKPENAVEYVAHYLLENNPRKPPIEQPDA